MQKESELKACVSGSFFKFKPEIDLAIEELNDLGVMVLSPSKGWLYKDPQRIYNKADYQFRPLPSELDMSVKQIEDGFLSCIRKSDFIYVINPGGYIGNVVAMEIGFAIALNKLVFLQSNISELIVSESDSIWDEIKPHMIVCTLQEAVTETRKIVAKYNLK